MEYVYTVLVLEVIKVPFILLIIIIINGAPSIIIIMISAYTNLYVYTVHVLVVIKVSFCREYITWPVLLGT